MTSVNVSMEPLELALAIAIDLLLKKIEDKIIWPYALYYTVGLCKGVENCGIAVDIHKMTLKGMVLQLETVIYRFNTSQGVADTL